MNRSAWRVLQCLAVPLFLLAIVVNLPSLIFGEWAPWVGKQLYRPFGYCNKRAQGWRVMGGLWTKHTGNRRVGVRR